MTNDSTDAESDDVALTAAAWSVWGKSDFTGDGLLISMPLVQHLFDSADVADSVWEWLPAHVRALIDNAIPGDPGRGRIVLRWFAGVHDVGKCSPPFASKVPALAHEMEAHGFVFPRVTTEFAHAPHGLVGHAVLTRWLQDRYSFSRRAATSFAVVVGGHHGTPPTTTKLRALRGRPQLVGEGRWTEVQDQILSMVTDRVGADEWLAACVEAELPSTTQALLTGAVIVADWLASNVELFPYSTADEADRAARAWEDLALPPPWSPGLEDEASLGDLMSRRFPSLAGYAARPIQELTTDAAREAESPSLLIVEAAMGSGKTEAALLAAEILASRFGCGGLYIALPTMATSDAIFGRVLNWIEHLDGSTEMSTYLAHGKHHLNEQFRELVTQPRAAGVYDDDADPHQTEPLVLSWLTGRKKGVLASMVVGTIDQLLFAALQAKHLMLRHLAFAGKVVVIDEAHASDDYMREYLTRALEWLAAYGVPVVLMSATLPRAQRQQLADAYLRGLGLSAVPLPVGTPYPAVTAVSADGVEVHQPADEAEVGRAVEVSCLDDDLDSLGDLLERLLRQGGCAAVIRNTVGRAQQTARFLRDRFPDVDVVVHHSRFVATHRVHDEARLRAQLGPDSEQRPTRQVVVGTQVLEQSLDIDFDVMVTDLAPMDLVLQRAGRLHRHSRGPAEAHRPEPLRTPRLYVTGITGWENSGPEFERGAIAVYGRSLLLRSTAVLDLRPEVVRQVRLPDDIRPLVEAAYADEIPGPLEWQSMTTADEQRAKKIAEQRTRADHYRIRPVDETDTLVGWLEFGAGSEAEDPKVAGASRVRDSEDGLEVIVVQRQANGDVVYLDDDSEYAGRVAVPYVGPPEDDVAQALAATTVRLPLALTHPGQFEATLSALEAQGHAVWQKSRWLAGQLVLHLDERWQTELAGWRVEYDRELGLMVSKEET